MTMRREVADFRARFSVDGLSQVRAEFAQVRQGLKGMDGAVAASAAGATKAFADAQKAQQAAMAGAAANRALVEQAKTSAAADLADAKRRAAMRAQEAKNLAAGGKWRAGQARQNVRSISARMDNSGPEEAFALQAELDRARAARAEVVQRRLADRRELRSETAAAAEMVAVAERAAAARIAAAEHEVRATEALQKELTKAVVAQAEIRAVADTKAKAKRVSKKSRAEVEGSFQQAYAGMDEARNTSRTARSTIDYYTPRLNAEKRVGKLRAPDYEAREEAQGEIRAAEQARRDAARSFQDQRIALSDARAKAERLGIRDEVEAPYRAKGAETAARKATAFADEQVRASAAAKARAAQEEALAARKAAEAEERRAEAAQKRADEEAKASATDRVYSTAEARRRADLRTQMAALKKPAREAKGNARDVDLGPDGMAEAAERRRALVMARLATRARLRQAVAAARAAGVEDDTPNDRDVRVPRYRAASGVYLAQRGFAESRAKAAEERRILRLNQAAVREPGTADFTTEERVQELKDQQRARRRAVERALEARKRVQAAFASAREATAAVEGEAILQQRAERAAAAERMALERQVTAVVVEQVAIRRKAQSQPSAKADRAAALRASEDPNVALARGRLDAARAQAAGASRVVARLDPNDALDEAFRPQALASRQQAFDGVAAERARLRAEQAVTAEQRAGAAALEVAKLKVEAGQRAEVEEARLTDLARREAAAREAIARREQDVAVRAAEEAEERRAALERALTRVAAEQAELRAAAERAPAVRDVGDAAAARTVAVERARENAIIIRRAEEEARQGVGSARRDASDREALKREEAEDAKLLADAAKQRQVAAQKSYAKASAENVARARLDALELARAENGVAQARAKAAAQSLSAELANGKAVVAEAEKEGAERVRIAREMVAEREALEKKITAIAQREADLRRKDEERAAREASQAEERAAREATAARREADRQADREERATDRRRVAAQRAFDRAERTRKAEERSAERAAEKADRLAAAKDKEERRAVEKVARDQEKAARAAERAEERRVAAAQRAEDQAAKAAARAADKSARDAQRAEDKAARATERAEDKSRREAQRAADREAAKVAANKRYLDTLRTRSEADEARRTAAGSKSAAGRDALRTGITGDLAGMRADAAPDPVRGSRDRIAAERIAATEAVASAKAAAAKAGTDAERKAAGEAIEAAGLRLAAVRAAEAEHLELIVHRVEAERVAATQSVAFAGRARRAAAAAEKEAQRAQTTESRDRADALLKEAADATKVSRAKVKGFRDAAAAEAVLRRQNLASEKAGAREMAGLADGRRRAEEQAEKARAKADKAALRDAEKVSREQERAAKAERKAAEQAEKNRIKLGLLFPNVTGNLMKGLREEGALPMAARGLASVGRFGAKAATVGGLAGTAAVGGVGGAAYKASSAAADRILEQFNASQSSGFEFGNYQAFVRAAARYGVDVNDVRSAMIQFQTQAKQAVSDPTSDLGKYFADLGIEAKDANDKIKTTDVLLSEVVAKSTKLGQTERIDFLSKMLGEDDIGKLLPLLNDMTSGAVDLKTELAALKANGTFIDDAAVARARAFKGAIGEVKAAWEGLQQRALVVAGPALQDWLQALAVGIGRFGDETMGWLYEWAQGSRVLLRDVARLWAGGWEGANDGIATYEQQWARVSAEAKKAGVVMESFTPQHPIQNRWLIDLRNGLSWVNYLVQKATPGLKTMFAALSGDARANAEFPWIKHLKTGLFAAGRLARELILTLGGDDKLVTEFPWLVTLRDAIGAVGRFARETFYAVLNDREQVKEYPWLLSIRDGIAKGIELVKRLGFELKAALTGNEQDVGTFQFAWIPAAKEKVVTFVQDVRRVWADLGAVWAGDRDAMTGPGQMFAGMMKSFDDLKAYIGTWQIWFQQVGADVALVWSQIGAPAKDAQAALDGLNFPNAKGLADDFLFVANAAKEGWRWFRAVYDQMFAIVGLAGINLESALFFLAFAKFTGTLGGLSLALGLIMKPLKWISAFLGLGGAVASAAGTAGAAGAVGSLTGALGGLLTKLEAIGLLAATPWGLAIFGGIAGGFAVKKLAENGGPLSFLDDWTRSLADFVNGTDEKLKAVEQQFARNAEVGGASPLAAQLSQGRNQAALDWEQKLAAERGRPDILAQAYVAPPPSPIRMEQPAAVRSEIPPVPVIFEIKAPDAETVRVPGYMDPDPLARARAASNRS